MIAMLGQTVFQYKVLDKLGEGGMGVVYKAHDTKLDRFVALKFLPPQLAVNEQGVARFLQEARAISALNHPGIATIHDIGEYENQRFLVLEYIAGGTLRGRLKQLKSEDKQFTIAEVVEYGLQIAEALSHAHQHGIVHRDVKTENIMLTEEGKVKLTDFGLAKLRGDVHITVTGSTVGTAAYMSPEQLRAEETDQRSDIFSFGIVLYELTSTHLPFRGDYESAMNFSILNETPERITSVRPDAPKALEQIIEHCLEKDKAKRYQDLAPVVAELQQLKSSLSGGSHAVARRSWLPFGIGAVILAAAIAILVFVPWLSHPAGANSKTLAVLPFVNISGDKQEEYFSDGITEDILTQLAKMTDLNIISRTSIMQYKGTSKPIREIGKELDAGVILEGSVRHSGNKVRIVAQLIDASGDKHLWAETYDREYKEIFAIQSEIAQNIALALKARLSSTEAERFQASAIDSYVINVLYCRWEVNNAPIWKAYTLARTTEPSNRTVAERSSTGRCRTYAWC